MNSPRGMHYPFLIFCHFCSFQRTSEREKRLCPESVFAITPTKTCFQLSPFSILSFLFLPSALSSNLPAFSFLCKRLGPLRVSLAKILPIFHHTLIASGLFVLLWGLSPRKRIHYNKHDCKLQDTEWYENCLGNGERRKLGKRGRLKGRKERRELGRGGAGGGGIDRREKHR